MQFWLPFHVQFRRQLADIAEVPGATLGPIKREGIARETASVVVAAINIEERRHCRLG